MKKQAGFRAWGSGPVVLLLLAIPAGSWAGGVVGGEITISADTLNEASVSLTYNPDRDRVPGGVVQRVGPAATISAPSG